MWENNNNPKKNKNAVGHEPTVFQIIDTLLL